MHYITGTYPCCFARNICSGLISEYDLSTSVSSRLSFELVRKVKRVSKFSCSYNSAAWFRTGIQEPRAAGIHTPQFELSGLTRYSVHRSFNLTFLGLQECGTRISRAPRDIKRKLTPTRTKPFPALYGNENVNCPCAWAYAISLLTRVRARFLPSSRPRVSRILILEIEVRAAEFRAVLNPTSALMSRPA